MRITQSILGNLDSCALKAQYTLDRPEWARRVSSASRALGTAYHAALESYYLQRLGDDGILPDVTEMYVAAQQSFEQSLSIDSYDNEPIDEFKWDDKIPDLEAASDLLWRLIEAYVGNKWFWPHNFTVLEVEANHLVTLPSGIQVKLGADLVLEDEAGWLLLADHKTAGRMWDEGKHKPRKNNQASLYTELARTIYPDHNGHRFVFDIITLPSAKGEIKFERRISDPEARHGQAVLRKAEALAVMYDELHVKRGLDLPANPSSTLCNAKFCDFFDGCPSGRVLD